MIYWDVDTNTGSLQSVNMNYWGVNFNASQDLYPLALLEYLPLWNLRQKAGTPLDEQLYEEGTASYISEDFAVADSVFRTLITTYPQSQYAVAALHELFALEQFLGDDYETLRDFYRESEIIASDSALFAAADFLATRCDVRLQNWQPSIDWYEARIQDPPSFPDSIFAVIDLGEIFLLMEQQEGDSTGLKAAQAVATTMAHLIPNSEGEYAEHKAELLTQLPKQELANDDFILPENTAGSINEIYPNPTRDVVNITYSICEEATVGIMVYNQMGQIVETKPQGKREAGSHQLEISLHGAPSGIYHCVLLVNEKKSNTKKVVVK